MKYWFGLAYESPRDASGTAVIGSLQGVRDEWPGIMAWYHLSRVLASNPRFLFLLAFLGFKVFGHQQVLWGLGSSRHPAQVSMKAGYSYLALDTQLMGPSLQLHDFIHCKLSLFYHCRVCQAKAIKLSLFILIVPFFQGGIS